VEVILEGERSYIRGYRELDGSYIRGVLSFTGSYIRGLIILFMEAMLEGSANKWK